MSFRACWLAAQEADKDAAEIHSDPSDFSPIELGAKRSESIPVDLTPQRVKRQKTQAAATAVSADQLGEAPLRRQGRPQASPDGPAC